VYALTVGVEQTVNVVTAVLSAHKVPPSRPLPVSAVDKTVAADQTAAIVARNANVPTVQDRSANAETPANVAQNVSVVQNASVPTVQDRSANVETPANVAQNVSVVQNASVPTVQDRSANAETPANVAQNASVVQNANAQVVE